jgi:hypothetical protein
MPMTQTSTATQNDIIRYIFNETSLKENVLIERNLTYDTESLDFFYDCLKISDDMKKISISPRESSIEKILLYSKNYEPAI